MTALRNSTASKDFYVYVHRRASDGRVFYVGKGKGKRAGSKTSRNQHWHNIVQKHGRLVEYVQKNMDEQAAYDLEKKLIAEYGRDSLCNLSDGGEGSPGLTEEAKERLRQSRLGKKLSEETKRKISESRKGIKLTEDHKKKLSKIFKGRRISEEQKKKLSDSAKNMSQEWRDKIGAAHRGKSIPQWQRDIISKKNTGRVLSKETREKMSASRRGKKLSEEHIKKLKAAANNRTPEHIEKIAAKNRGSKRPTCSMEKHHKARKVICVETGITFDCMKLAAIWLVESGATKNKNASGNISTCCAGGFKKAYGYTWRYA